MLSVLFYLGCLTSPAFGQPVQGTLEKIKSVKTITMGYREASIPFSYVGDDEQPVGYAIDLCTRVAAGIQQQLGLNDLQIKWMPVTPENRMAMVANGTIDIECGTTTNPRPRGALAARCRREIRGRTWVPGGCCRGLVSASGE
jgi:glutamate/aspartate transport system substrate-binding protein